MKKLRNRMIVMLLVVNTVSSVLAEILTWALLPVLAGGRDGSAFQLVKSAIQAGLTLMIFAVFVVISINELTRPIQTLSQAARRVAQGDYDIDLPAPRRKDEIGQLDRDFAAMVEELKSTEYMQRDFITNVSHEFKTPLAVISGYAKMLEQPEVTSQERIQCGRSIAQEAQRLSQMTSNILLLSRLNNQGIQPPYARFSLDEQLRQTVLLLENRWRGKQIEFRLEVDPLALDGNEELLSHVWINLVDNAIKYSKAAGIIEIRGAQEGSCVKVEVRDNGIGIDKATQARIFDQFYQGEPSREDMGNGLGLTLVKRIVEVHSGTVAVDSAPGEGTVFTVVLPNRT